MIPLFLSNGPDSPSPSTQIPPLCPRGCACWMGRKLNQKDK
uniref:Uncharacterized protein n=1 Tax=Rhizophora mucronata TaxID=61149 RepID=A0A2P2QBU5_RHIMU